MLRRVQARSVVCTHCACWLTPLFPSAPPHSTGQYFDGTIDEVRIWSRPLAQGEIKALMNTPLYAGDQVLSVTACCIGTDVALALRSSRLAFLSPRYTSRSSCQHPWRASMPSALPGTTVGMATLFNVWRRARRFLTTPEVTEILDHPDAHLTPSPAPCHMLCI